MQKIQKHLSLRTAILAMITAILMVLCLSGTARAALSDLVTSDRYEADFALSNLKVGLSENGDPVMDGELLGSISNPLKVGYPYPEELAAVNTGGYDQYVRVIVNKYWTNEEGKQCELDPALIELLFEEDGETIDLFDTDGFGDWVVVKNSPEQVVLYSTNPLAPEEVKAFATTLKLDKTLMKASAPKVSQDGNTFITKYTYHGFDINLEAEVDAVQVNNAADAVRSAWGVDPALLGL